MSSFNRNVYETFDRIHALIGNSERPDDATAMDRAEYQIQVNNLVEGLVELLQHAATHRLLSLDIGEFDHELEANEIGVYRDDSDEPAANHTVAIRVPDEYLPEDETTLSEAIAAFDLGTVETSADLAVAAMARLQLLANDDPDIEMELRARWNDVAAALVPRVAPSLRRLHAAGLLRVRDARTKRQYATHGVMGDEDDAMLELAFVSLSDGELTKKKATSVRRAAGAPAKKKRT